MPAKKSRTASSAGEASDSRCVEFNVLWVSAAKPTVLAGIRSHFSELKKSTREGLCAEPIFVAPTIDLDAALSEHPNIQAVVLQMPANAATAAMAQLLRGLRPELDLHVLTTSGMDQVSDDVYMHTDRVFFEGEPLRELLQALIQGVTARWRTPFFDALVAYGQRPIGGFHALPVSRGNSIARSRWIADFGDYFGANAFLAESSATHGGLDSLLQPSGPLRQAQALAARAYGADQTWFVTNGTSTANKIVVQALVEPGDIVLINRDCHKSHHYGLVHAGALTVYLSSWQIPEHGLYGAVPISTICEQLLAIRDAGKLERARLLVLTNCTFDGLIYDVEHVMEAVLAIKPDMIFLWDEAWFAFARFSPQLRPRTAMDTARRLAEKYRSDEYRRTWEEHLASLSPGELPTLPDPDRVKVRVYATQSTHKTMTSFRQGSMIHVRDEDFERVISSEFREAYMTHTSTSPSYPILASLDAGRRQAHLEGHALVAASIACADKLRAEIGSRPLLKRWYRILGADDLIPVHGEGFSLDPTKLTLDVGRTGMDGSAFKRLLMDRYHIQINKTAGNTVLLMTNIGTSSGALLQMIDALLDIAAELERERRPAETVPRTHKVPMPDFSGFHSRLLPIAGLPSGELRRAFYLGYDEANWRHVSLVDCLLHLRRQHTLVSAVFVTPYPPGFPVLVPGQLLSEEIVRHLMSVESGEVHGMEDGRGLKIFLPQALDMHGRVDTLVSPTDSLRVAG